MTQNEKLRALVRKMIAEGTSQRIKEIDAAGDIAANEAKVTRISEELNRANKISELLEKINLQHYIGEKLYEKVKNEMTKSIEEYESARLELEERMSGGKKPGKKSKKKDKESTEKDDKSGDEAQMLEVNPIEVEIPQ